MTGRPAPPPRPFAPEEFEEPCEDCEAPAGQLCRPHCGSGYTAADARHDQMRQQS